MPAFEDRNVIEAGEKIGMRWRQRAEGVCMEEERVDGSEEKRVDGKAEGCVRWCHCWVSEAN